MPVETLIPAPIEIVTPLTPAEAYRIGRMIRPLRINGNLFMGKTAACAVGAIAIGIGYQPTDADVNGYSTSDAVYELVENRFPEILTNDVWAMNDWGIPESDIIAYLENPRSFDVAAAVAKAIDEEFGHD